MLVINPIVYAEISARFDRVEELDEAIPASKSSPIADFYIGAHAAVCGYQLLTRDPARYRSYFPRLAVVAPGS